MTNEFDDTWLLTAFVKIVPNNSNPRISICNLTTFWFNSDCGIVAVLGVKLEKYLILDS